ncbi:DUF1842 domain-containing protein [Aquimarina longa]|uniref:DUF1842 domain-containing protein n=1 Tax=Aquimarina longa TaxID=1080221 RepID=UPI0007831996|nr:DUF1842 domain-containing protein [Aquimarina longa]
MSTQVEEKQALVGAYLASGTIGNVGLPGAPIAHFKLVVAPGSNSVSGTVEITQAILGPNSNIIVKNVHGKIYATGYGSVTKVVSLEGEYNHYLTPPAIGVIQEKFTAHLVLDDEWKGRGGFTYGNTSIEDVPVKPEN